MQISNNSTNFRGGFYVSNVPAAKKASFNNSISKGVTKIFDNFAKEGAQFIVTPHKNDKNVMFYVKHLHTPYVYYPQIQPDMRNANSEAGLTKIIDRLVASDEDVKNILSTLDIRIQNPIFSKTSKGVRIVKNPVNNDTILISPQNKNKINYVRVIPGLSQSEDSETRRYAVRGSKKIGEYDTVSGIFKFKEKFNGTLITSGT